MEHKKSLLIISGLTISAHLLLFANLNVEKKVDVQEIPPAQTSKINLKNVVIKKTEPKIEPIAKPVHEHVKLQKTQSKNVLNEVKKKKVQEAVKKEEVKEIAKEVQKVEPIQTVSNIPTKTVDEDPNLKNVLEDEYLAKIKETIEKNKMYPKTAKRLNQMGKVHICFEISKNGKIKNARIVKNSEFERLNEAAIEILTKIDSFEPIPEKLDKNSWEITVPIIYQITRS